MNYPWAVRKLQRALRASGLWLMRAAQEFDYRYDPDNAAWGPSDEPAVCPSPNSEWLYQSHRGKDIYWVHGRRVTKKEGMRALREIGRRHRAAKDHRLIVDGHLVALAPDDYGPSGTTVEEAVATTIRAID